MRYHLFQFNIFFKAPFIKTKITIYQKNLPSRLLVPLFGKYPASFVFYLKSFDYLESIHNSFMKVVQVYQSCFICFSDDIIINKCKTEHLTKIIVMCFYLQNQICNSEKLNPNGWSFMLEDSMILKRFT